MKTKTETERLAEEFLRKAKLFQANVEPIKVLKARVYQIADANVLIRTASEGNSKYFFGINYITIEEIANLDNPFIAFICGSIDKTVIIPAQLFFQKLPDISHDRNGEYKINIDRNLTLVLRGKGRRFDCNEYVNAWDLLLKPFDIPEPKNTAEESLHSILQGRLIEIGNNRTFRTYCPDNSKRFNNKSLSEISTLEKCPRLQFSDYDVLRKIDVLWFREKKSKLIPEYAFEVELSTGIWSGVGRLATLIDYSNVNLYVISNDLKRYNQVMHSFSDIEYRYHHVLTEQVGDLYSAELQLKELRYQIGL
ncbi:MAG: hypothetical protein ABR911_01035 [Syntrophales bacterium]|jgi:hypothetical protein